MNKQMLLRFASKADYNGSVSSILSIFFVRKILQNAMYWAKSWMGEYGSGSLLCPGTRNSTLCSTVVGPTTVDSLSQKYVRVLAESSRFTK